jgi:hypothetical protein
MYLWFINLVIIYIIYMKWEYKAIYTILALKLVPAAFHVKRGMNYLENVIRISGIALSV